MNLLLVGAASLPIGYMAFGFIALVVPPKCAPCSLISLGLSSGVCLFAVQAVRNWLRCSVHSWRGSSTLPLWPSARSIPARPFCRRACWRRAGWRARAGRRRPWTPRVTSSRPASGWRRTSLVRLLPGTRSLQPSVAATRVWSPGGSLPSWGVLSTPYSRWPCELPWVWDSTACTYALHGCRLHAKPRSAQPARLGRRGPLAGAGLEGRRDLPGCQRQGLPGELRHQRCGAVAPRPGVERRAGRGAASA
jgi:hypothetical protein